MESKQTIVLFLFFAYALNITLCQDQVPAPYNFAVVSVTETSVTLGWVAPESGTGYEITTTDREEVQKTYQISETSAVITDLKVFSLYTVRIRTVDGDSFSRRISVQALTLPQPNSIIANYAKGICVVMFKIDHCSEEIPCEFLLELRKDNELVLQVKSTKKKINVSGLSDGIYIPTVTATRDNYKGQPLTGNEITITDVVAGADVSAPSNLQAKVQGSSVLLTWDPTTSRAGYLVTVGLHTVPYYAYGIKTPRFNAKYLTPCTEYLITVRTISEGSIPTSLSIRTEGPSVTGASAKETMLASGKLTVYWNPIKPIPSCDWLFDISLNFNKVKIYRAVAPGTESSHKVPQLARKAYDLDVATSINGVLKSLINNPFINADFSARKDQLSAPYNFAVSIATETSISFGWLPPDVGTGYEITISDPYSIKIFEIFTIDKLSSTSVELSVHQIDLVEILFTIRTVNGAFHSYGSTLSATVVASPKIISIVQTEGKNEVKIETEFVLRYDIVNDLLLEFFKNNELVHRVITTDEEIFVTGLSNGTYTARITEIVDDYKGKTSPEIEFIVTEVTAEAEVSAPSSLTAKFINNLIFLEWKKASLGAGYRVTVGSDLVPYYVDNIEINFFRKVYREYCTDFQYTVATISEGSQLSSIKHFSGLKINGPRVMLAYFEETDPESGTLTVYWNPIKPIPSCDWLFDISLLSNEVEIYNAVAPGTESFYELYNVAANEYDLEVSTSFNGALGQNAHKYVIKKPFTAGNAPDDPTNIKVTDQSANTVSLSWTPTTNVVGYQYTLDREDPKFIINGGSVNGTKILRLEPSTKYTITVSSLTESSESKGFEIEAETKMLEQETK